MSTFTTSDNDISTEKTTQIQVDPNDSTTKFLNVYNECVAILDEVDDLTGIQVLRTMSYLVILKIFEDSFDTRFFVDDYPYNTSVLGELYNKEEHIKKILRLSRISRLSTEREEFLPFYIKQIWDLILSQHPVTKRIFPKDKLLDIRNKSTYKIVIDKLNSINFQEVKDDIMIKFYNEIIDDMMRCKDFKDYPFEKKIVVKLLNPELIPDISEYDLVMQSVEEEKAKANEKANEKDN